VTRTEVGTRRRPEKSRLLGPADRWAENSGQAKSHHRVDMAGVMVDGGRVASVARRRYKHEGRQGLMERSAHDGGRRWQGQQSVQTGAQATGPHWA
jgi:hypothetical protein